METGQLFSDVKFILAQCNNAENIKTLLIEGGAKHINYLSEHVTHVIADTNCPEAEEAVELFDKPVVKSLWVHLSIKAKRLLPAEAFSPINSIFHNVVAAFSKDLTPSDIDILAATITYFGGRISKNFNYLTHFVVASASPSDNPSTDGHLGQLKIVAPDWILESIRQNFCCDESLYEPSLLLSPKPPTPPPSLSPPRVETELVVPQQKEKQHTKPQENVPEPHNKNDTTKSTEIDIPMRQLSTNQVQSQPQQPLYQQQSQQHQNQLKQQQNQPSQQVQVLQQSQIPRLRLPADAIRGMQPKFRPILPPTIANNMPNAVQRQTLQPTRTITPDPQQPKKVTINYNQYRKVNPYQNNMENPQQQTRVQQPQSYPQTQHVPIHQQGGGPVQQPPNRMPQPNVYHQIRAPYQNSHLSHPPRPNMPPQQSMMNNQQQQQSHQLINRFHDPNNPHVPQRPYRICLQPQSVNAGYQQGNIHRQPIYYTQGSNQMQMRTPQPGPIVRPSMQTEQIVYDNFNQQPIQSQDTMQASHVQSPSYQAHASPQQQPYQQHPQPQAQQSQSQQSQPQHHQHHHHHPMTPQQQHHHQQQQPMQQPIQHPPQQQFHQQLQSPTNVQQRPQFQQPNTVPVGGVGNVVPIRPPQNVFNNTQQEPRPTNNIKQSNTSPQGTPGQIKNLRMPTNIQPLPHPSIFDHVQESNLAQIKAKVPNVNEVVAYFGYDPKANVPKEYPLFGCKFKLVDHDVVEPSVIEKWRESIKAAGGSFSENLEEITHLICEDRNSATFSEALNRSVRCVTIYWVNDVLAQNRLNYPWIALHLPIGFPKNEKILDGHIISVTNFKGKERRLVKEMILKTGAKYTDYFSQSNTLIICGSPVGEKYERAVEWRTPIANCQLLNDLLLGVGRDIDEMLKQAKYKIFNPGDSLKLNSYSSIRDLMKPWTKPIGEFDANTNSLLDSKNSYLCDKTEASESSAQVTTSLVSMENKESGELNTTALNNSTETSDLDGESKDGVGERFEPIVRQSNDPIRILFTRLKPTLVAQLETYSLKLGMGFASSPIDCTHLIVDRISRTRKFVCALNHASFILSYKWIIESYNAEKILDEKPFVLQDSEGEKKFSVNLAYSLFKRRKRNGLLFRNLIFFVTPSVLSSVTNMKEMIESAGGVITIRKPPTRMQINQMKMDGKRLVVVTNQHDLHLCSTVEPFGVDIVDAEFVLSGILRQDIDFESHRIPTTLKKEPSNRLESTPLTQLAQPSPPKKIRLD